tara:strand:- start:39 stop:284 length:246 start_codon:yes stop_codon:yes gene_type:complete
MAIAKKRPPQAPTVEMKRVVQTIYDDINDLINSVNQSISSIRSTATGSKGDLRVVKDGLNYRIEAFTDDGWASADLTILNE